MISQNLLIEIPKETIKRWEQDILKYLSDSPSQKTIVEDYIAIQTGNWRLAERNKNTVNELVLNYDKEIAELKSNIESLKNQIRK